MNDIKSEFGKVVKDNISLVLNYVKSRLKNKDLAEDIVQEVFIRAFKAYGSYCEEGRIKSWLLCIARNTLNNYYSSKQNVFNLSFDGYENYDESLYNCISVSTTPEDDFLKKELIGDILTAVGRLPKLQKQVFTLRFFEQCSVSETAVLTGIPEGSVKSKTHYAIRKIRTELGITQNNNRRIHNMKCKEANKYLFMYANNTIDSKIKEEVKKHIETCSECADIVSALKKLIPQLIFAQDDETTHFLINFPKYHLTYCGCSAHFNDTERLNKYLEEHNGKVPENEIWLSSGFSKCNELIGMFDNEGNEIKYEIIEESSEHFRTSATYIKKLFPLMWIYFSYFEKGSPKTIKKSPEAPNLYYGHMHNSFGGDVKSALYQAIPKKAENIRIKRGNGYIDCGSYKFAFVDRYVTEEERISLDYSFLLDE